MAHSFGLFLPRSIQPMTAMQDQSDNLYCSDNGSSMFLSYDWSNTLRIVPCDQCKNKAFQLLLHERQGYQYQCSDGKIFGGVKQICDYSQGQLWVAEFNQYDCRDRSDNQYCADDWVFNGCLSYEGSSTLRIVPCDQCICSFEDTIDCLNGAHGSPQCKVCLTSSSVPEEGKTCGYPFEMSKDFIFLLRDNAKSVAEKKKIIQDGTWKCQDRLGNIVPCDRRSSRYFLYAYDSFYQCPLKYWRPSGEDKCIRKPYPYKNSCPGNLKPCNQICSLPQEPCNAKCRDGWITCYSNEDICYPDYKHCCTGPDLFYCESTQSCEKANESQLCPDGSCRNLHENCSTCPQNDIFCEATKQCEEKAACFSWSSGFDKDELQPRMYQNSNITSVNQTSSLPDAFDASTISPELAIGLSSLLVLGVIITTCIITCIIVRRKSPKFSPAVRFEKTDVDNEINVAEDHEYAEVVTDDVAENDYYGGGRSNEVKDNDYYHGSN